MNRWIISAGVLAVLMSLNGYMQAQEDKANAAYAKQVVEKKKAAQDKAFNDLAERGEFMTGFKAVAK